MSLLFSDTRPEAETVLLNLLRNAPPWRKMQMVVQLNIQMKLLLLAGLRQRQPLASASELHRHMADLLLGEELAMQVYGHYPLRENDSTRENAEL